jgi:hypothetical protein
MSIHRGQRAHGRTRDKLEEMINLMLHPANGVDPSTAIEKFIDTVVLHATTDSLIAWETRNNAFKVYKPRLTLYCLQVGKQCNTAVIKVIQGVELDNLEETKAWAWAGYLLARAEDKATKTTYLILKVTIPNRKSQPSELEMERLMHGALKEADLKPDATLY